MINCPLSTATQKVFDSDSYIRLTVAEIELLRLTHLSSDEEVTLPTPRGWTEWAAKSTRSVVPVCIAWNWILQENNNPVLDDCHPIASNVMLITKSGYDIGPIETEKQLASLINRLNWQGEVLSQRVKSAPRYDIDLPSMKRH